MRLRLLTRPGCHLCEDFEQALLAQLQGRAEVELADVDSRADWQRRHGLTIPVLLAPDGAVVCATHLDAAAVEDVVRR